MPLQYVEVAVDVPEGFVAHQRPGDVPTIDGRAYVVLELEQVKTTGAHDEHA
jgi:hypothetical protein